MDEELKEQKPKRQMTEQQLENLKKGREKKRLLLLQSKEVTADKKLSKKQEKELKEQKLKEEYDKVMEKKKQKETPVPQPQANKVLAKQEEQEESEKEEEYKPVLQKPRVKKQAPIPAPPPASRVLRETEGRRRSPPLRKPKPAPVRRQTDEEMYGNASLELLRKKLQQETRQRLLTDLFNY